MLSLLVRLALIALLAFAGVTYWYGRAEQRLQDMVPEEKKETITLRELQTEEGNGPAKHDYQVILTRNLFKAVLDADGQAPEAGETDLDSLAETRMKLVLLGTVSGSREDARAIIRDEAARKEDIYQVGSDVQGALVTRIERGRVVLQVNGSEEVLNIKDPGTSGPQGGGAQPTGMTSPVPLPGPPMPTTPTAQGGQAEEIDDRKVPEALPRRRINFRNPPPVDGGVTPPPPIVEAEEQQPDATEAETPVPDDKEPIEEAPANQ